MRTLIMYIVFLSFNQNLIAQVVQVPVRLNDALSNRAYKHITKHNQQIQRDQTIFQFPVTEVTKQLMEDQNRELYVINPFLKNQKGLITNYINLDCKNYIRFKYPAFSKVPGVPISKKNLVIRNRLMKKFNKERKLISDYLEPVSYTHLTLPTTSRV